MTDMQSAGPIQILVLEDEPLILMELALSLQDENVEPVTATNCADALRSLDEGALHAAILDVNLGRGTTCEPVAHALAARGIPFLLHSGDLVRQGELIEGIDAEVIPKPASGRTVARRAVELAGRTRIG